MWCCFRPKGGDGGEAVKGEHGSHEQGQPGSWALSALHCEHQRRGNSYVGRPSRSLGAALV